MCTFWWRRLVLALCGAASSARSLCYRAVAWSKSAVIVNRGWSGHRDGLASSVHSWTRVTCARLFQGRALAELVSSARRFAARKCLWCFHGHLTLRRRCHFAFFAVLCSVLFGSRLHRCTLDLFVVISFYRYAIISEFYCFSLANRITQLSFCSLNITFIDTWAIIIIIIYHPTPLQSGQIEWII